MLQAYCLQVDIEMTTPLALDEYCGSALRGAFFRALWGRFCTNREALTCTACRFATGCPVAILMAPVRGDGNNRGDGDIRGDGNKSNRAWNGYGNDLLRPFLLIQPQSLQAIRREERGNEAAGQDEEAARKQHPMRTGGIYSKGDHFAFGLTLFGSGVKFLPYVLRALQEMERFGLGRPQQDLGGRRGRFFIREMRAYHPFTGAEQPVWQQGKTDFQPLALSVTPEDIAARARQLSQEHLTVHFLSPTCLVNERTTIRRPTFYSFMTRLADRLTLLHSLYSEDRSQGGVGPFDKAWYLQIGTEAGAVRLIRDETRWAQVSSHSARQQRTMPLDGFVGRASYQGDLSHLRELLVWGEVIGVGKNVTKGGGHYHIVDTEINQGRKVC